ncbi:oligosaccharide flippase family protein [Paraburkholderia mimosarum]|uniref:oligosaccharide flippase family protein n=1 Tax=Paraburkholderia mimosarum TaxID=312026 RepID=UPI0039C2AF41
MRSIRAPLGSVRLAFHGSAPSWVLIQQVVVRGLAAVKFLAIGRILGPAAIGNVGVALLAVAIAEALSDTGLNQAVVQAKGVPTRSELGAVWTTLTTRGAFIALLLIAVAPLMNAQFHLNGSVALLQLAAALPLIRGLASPAYFMVQRDRRFQRLASVETSSAFADCAVGLLCALSGAGAYAVLIGMIVGETLKTVLTWLVMGARPPVRLKWSGIGHYVNFSRWIWAGSVVNLVLNQFDKVLVGRLLGPAALGAYQMSSRFAQMLLADAAIAMSQYLFPTFSAHNRKGDGSAAKLFTRYLAFIAVGLVVVVLTLRMTAEPLFMLLLGPAWMSAVPLFKIFVINMAIGALIAVLVAYLRAIGDPKATTQASVLQGVLLLLVVPPATYGWGVTGVAWAMTASLTASAGWMCYRIIKRV